MLDEAENVVRYAGARHFDENTGVPNGSVFDRTSKDIDGLSIVRRGLFASDPDADRNMIRQVVGSWMSIGKTAKFLEFGVGAAIIAVTKIGHEIQFCADPLSAVGQCLANPAHALILNLPIAGEAVGSVRSEAINDKLVAVVHDIFPAALLVG